MHKLRHVVKRDRPTYRQKTTFDNIDRGTNSINDDVVSSQDKKYKSYFKN